MTRVELEIMWALKRVIGAAPEFVVAFMGEETTAEAEIAFAHQLVDVAEALMHHANAKSEVVLDGEVIAVGVDTAARPALEAGSMRQP